MFKEVITVFSTRTFRLIVFLILSLCFSVILVCNPSLASDTATKSMASSSESSVYHPENDRFSSIDHWYFYQIKPPDPDWSLSEEFYKEHDDEPVETVSPLVRFTSDTQFVDYYLKPLEPTYEFLDKERDYHWRNFTFEYTLSELDSSLYYKMKMFGWKFKAEARSEITEETSVRFNWKKTF